MKKTLLSIVSIMLFWTPSNAVNLEDDLLTLKKNYKNTLLFEGEEDLIDVLITLPYEKYFSDQVVVELLDRYPIESNLVKKYIAEIKEDGSWADIDYESKSRSGWRPKIHTERILLLVRAYTNKEHECFGSQEIEDTIHKALKFWFDAKLVCPNWWYNQIGIPKTLGAAFILFEDKLTAEERVEAIAVLGKSKFGMTGQNKVWLAGNVLVKALLENDFETVKLAQKEIFSEIVIGKGKKEGIKSDWSFHQHGAQQQFGNYGASFLSTTSFWAKVFSNTSFAMEQESLDLLHQLITQGYQRVLWKGYLDINGVGRQFYKQTQKHKAFSVMLSSKTLSDMDAKNKASYDRLIDENVFNTQLAPSLTGIYHFWLSDQTVQRTSAWMTSVKMSSKRVIGAEGGNGDNKKGYYLADGATYTYINGDEYYNIGAVWDWRKIPGTTVYDTALPLKELRWLKDNNQSDFVGNATQGDYGMTVMDLNRDGLTATKAWVFSPTYTLCMGAGIATDSLCNVVTTMEQNLQKGDLFYLKDNSWQIVENEMLCDTEIQRFYHNKTGYIVWGNNTTAKVEKRMGSWHDVMNTYPAIKEEIDSQNVLTIFQNHGVKPSAASYQYLILPNCTQKEVKDFNVNDMSTIGNNKSFKSLHLKKKKLLFIAAVDGCIDTKKDYKGIEVKTNHPCIMILNYGKKQFEVTISDPTQKLSSIELEVNGKKKLIELPTGEMRGTSVTVSL